MERNDLSDIRCFYERRQKAGIVKRWSPLNKGALYVHQIRERGVLDIIGKFCPDDLSSRKVLDVGCGGGSSLATFLNYGFLPENLHGLDIRREALMEARYRWPNISYVEADAAHMPYQDGLFDILLQWTMFCQILDGAKRSAIAREMLRVLKPDGYIIWFDWCLNNPRAPDIRGVGKRELFKLFPGCQISLHRIVLAPPLARLIAPFSFILCECLGKIPFLAAAYLAVIKKRP